MKKIFLSLIVIMVAFAATVSITGCSPTAGLEEITFEEIVDAKLYDSYSVTSKTITYSNGSKKSESKDETTMTGAEVKTSIAASKILIETAKLIYPKTTGKVCANSNYSKIVTYVYEKNSKDELVYEIINTYRKN